MNLKHLFFHIHYCNFRKVSEFQGHPARITRTIQHHELILVTGGKGSISIDQKNYPVKEGTLIYLYPDLLHSIEKNIADPISFLSVHFSYAAVNFNDNRWDVKKAVAMLPLHLVQELKDSYQVHDVFKKLVESWNAKLPGYEFLTRTLLQQLFIVIFQNLRKQNQNYATSLKVEKIIQTMQQNIGHKLTLTWLAELAQLSPTYLSRAFKETTGYSIIEYFNKLKIDKAKELLIEGDKKVKEVAGALGFSDEFYFSRIFKKIEGMSPSEYYSRNVHGV